jgi:hypothetical protein
MKIIVQSLEKKPTDNITDFSSDNRKLSDVAFNFQNFKLAELTKVKPMGLEIIINVFYNAEHQIKWNFATPDLVPTEIKLQIIDLLSQ